MYYDDSHYHCKEKNGHYGNHAGMSPTKPQLVVLAKAVPYLILSIINITTIFVAKRVCGSAHKRQYCFAGA